MTWPFEIPGPAIMSGTRAAASKKEFLGHGCVRAPFTVPCDQSQYSWRANLSKRRINHRTPQARTWFHDCTTVAPVPRPCSSGSSTSAILVIQFLKTFEAVCLHSCKLETRIEICTQIRPTLASITPRGQDVPRRSFDSVGNETTACYCWQILLQLMLYIRSVDMSL